MSSSVLLLDPTAKDLDTRTVSLPSAVQRETALSDSAQCHTEELSL